MRVKISNITPGDNRLKLIKQPDSVVNLGPQPGAVGEDSSSVFMCLSPSSAPVEYFGVQSYMWEVNEGVALSGDFAKVKLSKRLEGTNTFESTSFDLSKQAPHVGGSQSVVINKSAQVAVVWGEANDLDQFPIQIFVQSNDLFEPRGGSRLDNDCQEVLGVSISYDDLVIFVVYLDKQGKRRQVFFINEDAEYNQKPSTPTNFQHAGWLNYDGSLLLAPQFQSSVSIDIYDVNKVSGTISAQPYELSGDTFYQNPQLIGSATFNDDANMLLVCRYNALEMVTINRNLASANVTNVLNDAMKAEIGNYPIEIKYTLLSAAPGPNGKILAIVQNKDWVGSFCAFDVDQSGKLIGTLTDAHNKGYKGTTQWSQQDAMAVGPYTNDFYIPNGDGLIALKGNADNSVTEIARA